MFDTKTTEFILIDDGSRDKTGEFLRRIQERKRDFDINIFLNKNIGQARERNFGLKQANGEFIFFLDSDDIINKIELEKIYKYFKNNYNKKDLFIFGYSKVVNGIQNNRTLDRYIDDKDEIIRLFFEYKKDPIGGYVWNKIIKKELTVNIEFADMKYEDVPFIFSILNKATSVIYLPIDGYHYLYHEESTVNVITNNLILDRIESLEMVSGAINNNNKLENIFFAYEVNALIYLWRRADNPKIRIPIVKYLNSFSWMRIMINRQIIVKNKIKYLLILLKNIRFWRVS